jgi:hypothetical protein
VASDTGDFERAPVWDAAVEAGEADLPAGECAGFAVEAETDAEAEAEADVGDAANSAVLASNKPASSGPDRRL